MNYISSESNELIKKMKKMVHSSRTCRKEGQTVAEGIHLAKELANHPELIRAVILRKDALENQEVSEVVSVLPNDKKKFYEVPASVYNVICPVEQSVGICCLIDIPKPAEIKPQEDWVFMDDVQDPGNVGTIIRSALASDVKNVALSVNSAYPWAPKALRAGMGIHFLVNIHTGIELSELKRKTEDVCLVADARGGESLFNDDWGYSANKTIWVFGNEGQGVSREALTLADKVLLIPLNPAVESLNVAMAASVCLFEQKRRRLSKK